MLGSVGGGRSISKDNYSLLKTVSQIYYFIAFNDMKTLGAFQ